MSELKDNTWLMPDSDIEDYNSILNDERLSNKYNMEVIDGEGIRFTLKEKEYDPQDYTYIKSFKHAVDLEEDYYFVEFDGDNGWNLCKNTYNGKYYFIYGRIGDDNTTITNSDERKIYSYFNVDGEINKYDSFVVTKPAEVSYPEKLTDINYYDGIDVYAIDLINKGQIIA